MSGQPAVSLSDLEARVSQALAGSGPERFEVALRSIAAAFGAPTGTLHRAEPESQMLHLVAQLGLPEALLPITQHIPFGKGIAGLCAVQQEPVTLCNLQTDDSGKARPNAKQTGVAGAIAVPVFAPDAKLNGILGVGKIEEHTYTDEEHRVLAACAKQIGRALNDPS
jgi:signal transduction protein with GAF and PtsI domain